MGCPACAGRRFGFLPADLADFLPDWLVNLVADLGRAGLAAEALAVGDALAAVDPAWAACATATATSRWQLARAGLVDQALPKIEENGDLKSQNIPPTVLRRLAEQDPDRAGRVFARLLGRSRFTWQHDGEMLLLRYKKQLLDRAPLPGVTPLSDRQRAFLRP